jgi:hypothetical protein
MKLTVERLREALNYDPETGVLTWRPRPVGRSQHRSWNTKYAGKPAGTLVQNGYLHVVIDGIAYRAHRLAWMHVHSTWPDSGIDHRDVDRTNNRLSNLRLASPAQNSANQRTARNNTSGVKGVSWSHNERKWRTSITVCGRSHYLGHFVSKDDAAIAYATAAVRLNGEFARTA